MRGATAVMSPEAERVIELAKRAGVSLGTAESLTGGMVCEALVAVPGASAVVRGGIVAYDAEVKISALGVPPLLLEREGPVSSAVASAMARGARKALGADVVVATTGAAGPDSHGGKPAGTVVIAVVGPGRDRVTTVHIDGDRDDVMRGAVSAALDHLTRLLSALAPS